MRPKSVIAPCRFCQKQFQRAEHLLRHERTHTKEKPFACHCGKAFTRRDLLSRHERLAHQTDSTIEAGQQPTTPANATAGEKSQEDFSFVPTSRNTQHSSHDSVGIAGPYSHHNLSSLDDTSTQNFGAQNVSHPWNSPEVFRSTESGTPGSGYSFTNNAVLARQTSLQYDTSFGFQYPPAGFTDDLDMLWSDFDMNAGLLRPTSFDANYLMNFLALSDYGIPHSDFTPLSTSGLVDPHENNSHDECGPMSRYASRLPSIQPEAEPWSAGSGALSPEKRESQRRRCASGSTTPGSPWRISRMDHQLIGARLQREKSALPSDFSFPSRHAISRYVEGFFSGFHEHLPFLHVPTICIATTAPELILAILAVGAQYRFQRAQAHRFYIASKSLIEKQVRQRDGYGTPRSVMGTSSLSDGNLQSQSSAGHGARPSQDSSPYNAAQDPLQGESERKCRIETMQAMILLIAFGTWNHRSLLKDALSMASQLGLLVREDVLSEDEVTQGDQSWQQWVYAEGRRRTRIVAYCFLNLQSVAYNIPPKLMNAEMCVNLPRPEIEWKALSQEQWINTRRGDLCPDVSFREGYAALFADVSSATLQKKTLSSFGNYVLIHSIIQQIFFARQSSPNFGADEDASLPSEVLTRIETALRRWQYNWESTKDSSIDPSSPSGPLSFNSIALFRVAYIRLHADIGSCRKLETRDPVLIARAFEDTPHLARSSHVCRAVLQSAHSLSIPVRIGIEFVARTQTLTWSIVHSLCNLECAFFLSKWLRCIATKTAEGMELREDEKRLLRIVRSILSETDMGVSIEDEMNESHQAKRMAAAVVRLWAETFKGAHVFEIMGTIGAGLELHADMLDRELAAME